MKVLVTFLAMLLFVCQSWSQSLYIHEIGGSRIRKYFLPVEINVRLKERDPNQKYHVILDSVGTGVMYISSINGKSSRSLALDSIQELEIPRSVFESFLYGAATIGSATIATLLFYPIGLYFAYAGPIAGFSVLILGEGSMGLIFYSCIHGYRRKFDFNRFEIVKSKSKA